MTVWLYRVIIRTVPRIKKIMRSADFKPSRQTGYIRTMKLKGEQMMDWFCTGMWLDGGFVCMTQGGTRERQADMQQALGLEHRLVHLVKDSLCRWWRGAHGRTLPRCECCQEERIGASKMPCTEEEKEKGWSQHNSHKHTHTIHTVRWTFLSQT